MKLYASKWWLYCVILLLMFTIFAEAQKCADGEILRLIDCQRTCKKTKECNAEKAKKCICRGSLLRDEDSGKCVQPQDCPPT